MIEPDRDHFLYAARRSLPKTAMGLPTRRISQSNSELGCMR